MTDQAKRIIIDCDPGLDDAVAILLAAGSPAVEISAITTVAGNQTLEKVTHNAARVATLAGLAHVPIAAGCDRPLLRDQITAGDIHGSTGLDGPAYFEPQVPVVGEHAVDLIIDLVLASPGEITLVPIGPLTNIAIAARREPRLVEAVAEVVLMGGSYTRGNTTPAAEFNILADPEAAAAVFAAPWPITMVGLDLTGQARTNQEVLDRIESLNSTVSRFVLDLLGHYDRTVRRIPEAAPPAIHDACAVARVIDPTLTTDRLAHVAVETKGELTYGMTVTDFSGKGHAPNASVPTDLDVRRFWDLLLDSLARVDGRSLVR